MVIRAASTCVLGAGSGFTFRFKPKAGADTECLKCSAIREHCLEASVEPQSQDPWYGTPHMPCVRWVCPLMPAKGGRGQPDLCTVLR